MDNTYLFLNTSTSVYYSTKNKQYYIADELQETQDGIDLISQASKAAFYQTINLNSWLKHLFERS